jgi:hypothetical protein
VVEVEVESDNPAMKNRGFVAPGPADVTVRRPAAAGPYSLLEKHLVNAIRSGVVKGWSKPSGSASRLPQR